MTEVYNNPEGVATDGASKPGHAIYFYHVPSNVTVAFKAFITDFSDQFNTNWESEPIYGRMDPVKTFSSTERTITLSFDVVARNLNEAKINLANVSRLAQFHYPSYNSEGQMSTTAINESPLLRVKYLNWICKPKNPEGDVSTSGLLVASTGFSFSPAIGDLTFSEENKLFPKVFNVSLNLEVIHEHTLGWEAEKPRNEFSQFPYDNTLEIIPPSGVQFNMEEEARERAVAENIDNFNRWKNAVLTNPGGKP